jgi:hypothetical protein
LTHACPALCSAAAHLAEAGVEVKEYGALLGDVRSMAAAGTKLWMDPARVRRCRTSDAVFFLCSKGWG